MLTLVKGAITYIVILITQFRALITLFIARGPLHVRLQGLIFEGVVDSDALLLKDFGVILSLRVLKQGLQSTPSTPKT